MLTAWVALSDVAADGGAMRFVRGSNHWGLVAGADFFHAQDLESQRAACLSGAPPGAQWEEVPAVLPAGSLALHDCYTLHGSGPNRSSVYRRSLAIHLRTDKAKPKSSALGTGLTEFLDDFDTGGVNPVIYGKPAFLAEQRARGCETSRADDRRKPESTASSPPRPVAKM